jgi:hypothetical protein
LRFYFFYFACGPIGWILQVQFSEKLEDTQPGMSFNPTENYHIRLICQKNVSREGLTLVRLKLKYFG